MLHKALPPIARHPAHGLEYADATARLAATPVAGDEFKFAVQLDTRELFFLARVEPVVWMPMTAPGDPDFDGGAPSTASVGYTLDGGAYNTSTFGLLIDGGTP